MAIERGQSLQRGTRSTKVTNQFGVVRSEASRFGEALGNVADAATKFTQFQADIIDQNWKTDFKTKTLEFYTDLENKYLNSPQPDFNALKAEVNGYKSSLLSKAPKRFENLVKNYTDQNSIDVFDKVKNYSNKLLFKQTKDNLFIDIENIQNQVNKELISLDDSFSPGPEYLDTLTKQESINLILGKFTPEITDLSEKIETLKRIEPLQFGDYEEATVLNDLFANLENQRVIAITSSFYDDVNFEFAESVQEADIKHQEFLLNYKDGKEFRAAQNLDSQNLNKIINNSNSRARDIKAINKSKIDEGKRKTKNIHQELISVTTDLTGDLNRFTNADGGYVTDANGDIASIEQILNDDQFKIGNNRPTFDEAKKIHENMFYKKIIQNIYSESENFSRPMMDYLNDPLNAEAVEYFGGAEKVLENYVNNKLFNINTEDFEKTILNGTWKNDQNLKYVMDFVIKNNQSVPQLSQLFNKYNNNSIKAMYLDEKDQVKNIELFEGTFQAWKYLTNNGVDLVKGISDDANELFSNALKIQNLFPNNAKGIMSDLIEHNELKIKNSGKISSGGGGSDSFFPMHSNVEEFFYSDNDIGEKSIMDSTSLNAETSNFYQGIPFFGSTKFDKAYFNLMKSEYEVYLSNIGDDIKGSYLGSPKGEEIFKDINKLYTENQDYFLMNKKQIDNQIKYRMNKVASGGESPESLKTLYDIVSVQVLNSWANESNRGPTTFAPNGFGELAYVSNSAEKNHGRDGKPLDKKTMDSYVYTYLNEAIQQAKKVPIKNDQLRNIFTKSGEAALFGAEDYPYNEDLWSMVTSGAVELEWVRGKGANAEYQVKLNMGATSLFDPNQFDADELLLNVNGDLFNPTKMYDTNFAQIKTKVSNQIAEKLNNKDDPVFNQATGGLWNQLYDALDINALVGKGIEFAESVGFDIGGPQILKGEFGGKDKPSGLQVELMNVIKKEYDLVLNDTATQFVKNQNRILENSDLSIVDISKNLNRMLNSNSPLKKNKMFKTNDEYYNTSKNLIENVEYFSQYNNYEQSLLLDAVMYNNTDLTLLNKFTKSGDVKLIDKLFPDSNDYYKSILKVTFGY